MLKNKLTDRSGTIFVTVILLVMLMSVTTVFVAITSRAQVNRFFYIQSHLIHYPLLAVAQAYAVDVIKHDAKQDVWKAIDYAGAIGAVFQPDNMQYSVDVDDTTIAYGEWDEEGAFHFGFLDEDGKLNINAVKSDEQRILYYLLEYLDVGRAQAEEITASLLDWKDADLLSTHEHERLEVEYYKNQDNPLKPMNKPFQVLQEIRNVRGMDEDVFALMRPHITVYAANDAGMKVNFLTIGAPVLYALVKSLPAVSSNDARFIAEDFVRLRGLFFSDFIAQASVSMDDIIGIGQWSPRHQVLLQSVYQKFGKIRSDIIRIPVILKSGEDGVPMQVTYIYNRLQDKIVGQYMR